MNADTDADGAPASGRRVRAVTISREYGSGGGEIAARLARRLGWDLVDHAIVERTARALGTSIEDAEAHDESIGGFVSQLLEALRPLDAGYLAMAGAPPDAFLSAEDYHRTAEKIVWAAAARAQVVIVGRASQVILADRQDVMHVRVVAPFAQRVAYVMGREGIDRHTAEARIRRKDHERASSLEREYHHRPDEAQLYDLVVNTSRLDLDSAVDVVCFTLHEIATSGRGQASTTGEPGPAIGGARYPTPPADVHPPAR
jgi:CMP/dCMP kinase